MGGYGDEEVRCEKVKQQPCYLGTRAMRVLAEVGLLMVGSPQKGLQLVRRRSFVRRKDMQGEVCKPMRGSTREGISSTSGGMSERRRSMPIAMMSSRSYMGYISGLMSGSYQSRTFSPRSGLQ